MVARKEYNAEGFKHCYQCNKWKEPLIDFNVHKGTWDGRRNVCRACERLNYQEWVKDPANRERKRKASERWNKKNPERMLEISQKWREDNRERERERMRKRRQDNPNLNRERWLRGKYGISLSEYSQMLDRQNGVCAICKNTCTKNLHLVVDHCHLTNINRGLLCNNCNTAIGMLKEDPIIIDAALMYIINHRMRIQENVG